MGDCVDANGVGRNFFSPAQLERLARCINWPCQQPAGHKGPCSTARQKLSGKSDGRGRNGWFKAAQTDCWTSSTTGEPMIVLEVMSSREPEHSPIQLWLTPEDAQAIVTRLQNGLNELELRTLAALVPGLLAEIMRS